MGVCAESQKILFFAQAQDSGWRNPWSEERARFLSAWREESEERIELVFLARKIELGFEDTGLSLPVLFS